MWYEKINHLDQVSVFSDEGAISNVLRKIAMNEARELHSYEAYGTPACQKEDVYRYLNGLGARNFYSASSMGDNHFTKSFVWDDGHCVVGFSEKNCRIGVCHFDEKIINDVRENTHRFIKHDKRGIIHALVKCDNKHKIQSIGREGSNLIRENYQPDVLKAYDKGLSDMLSKDPSGRLMILNGPPGTGKTYMIRSLMENIDAQFIFIPTDLLKELSGPELISVFVDSQMTNKRNILILEDADSCLVPRATDNMGSIAALLNLADGILGSALDLFVIATTNAQKLELDPAIMRPGRLCSHAEVGPLSYSQSKEIFERISGRGDLPLKDGYALSELYALKREMNNSDDS